MGEGAGLRLADQIALPAGAGDGFYFCGVRRGVGIYRGHFSFIGVWSDFLAAVSHWDARGRQFRAARDFGDQHRNLCAYFHPRRHEPWDASDYRHYAAVRLVWRLLDINRHGSGGACGEYSNPIVEKRETG